MSGMEKEKLIEIVEHMDSEELRLVLRAIPSEYMFEELMRRDRLMTQMLNGINGLLNGGEV